jgi:hypothetical protein
VLEVYFVNYYQMIALNTSVGNARKDRLGEEKPAIPNILAHHRQKKDAAIALSSLFRRSHVAARGGLGV